MARVIRIFEASAAHMAARALREGLLAIMPCDTIYGITGVAPNTEARIRALKGRGESKPLIRLISDVAWLEGLVDSLPPKRLAALWPGPLTLVLPAQGGGTVAVRLPADPFLRQVMREVGAPLFSTSVNFSGQGELWSISEIVASFGPLVELIVDGGDRPGGVPSTVVDATQRPCRVLREGAMSVPEDVLAGQDA